MLPHDLFISLRSSEQIFPNRVCSSVIINEGRLRHKPAFELLSEMNAGLPFLIGNNSFIEPAYRFQCFRTRQFRLETLGPLRPTVDGKHCRTAGVSQTSLARFAQIVS